MILLNKKKNRFQLIIRIRIESQTFQIPKIPLCIYLAKQMGLLVESFVKQKKRNDVLITVISGPHVHKKSRDQLYIPRYSGSFIIKIQDESDLKTFLEYRKRLFLEDVVFSPTFRSTFTYQKKEILDILL